MTEVTTLSAHDPLPTGHGVTVLRRFEEDAPGGSTVQIILSGKREETTRPRRKDGGLMTLDEAVEAAKMVAESEGLKRVFVIDRLQGSREQDILQHSGDHSVHMDQLQDTDPEDGERGADMRDIAHPASDR
ncbi:MAG: hypothetical protein ACRYGM_11765 [Janthinobacterium lividum]